MNRTITPAQHAELKRRVAHAQGDRDLAHEADMRELQRQQLRGDISVEEANATTREAYWEAQDAAYWEAFDEVGDDQHDQYMSYHS